MSRFKVKAVDVFVCSTGMPKFEVAGEWKCTDIFNRGTRVGPDGNSTCHMTDVFQCRFSAVNEKSTDSNQVLKLLTDLNDRKVIWSNVHIIWAD